MKKIVCSIKNRPINLWLMLMVAALYLINNCYLKIYAPQAIRWFFICYFNDLICPLLFFGYVNILLLTKGKELSKLKLILLFGLLVSIVWEYGAPILKESSITDIGDIGCYLIGSILYWWILKKNIKVK